MPAMKTKRATPNRKFGRAGGRTQLQEAQRVETRDRLLKAAQASFSKYSYATTSVEDIIKLAGASRTSFYRHFDSKWTVASKLCEQVMPSVWSLWNELASYTDPSEEQIARWLERRVAFYRAHRILFSVLKEAVAIEPRGTEAVTANHDEAIRVLATGIPAFRLALSPVGAGQEIRMRAYLLLMQLDELNYALAIRDWEVDQALALRVMAQQFRRFIKDAAAKG